jgi:regulator of nonsense transcripts 2
MFEADFEAQIELQSQIDAVQREKAKLIETRNPNLPANIVAFRKQNESKKKMLKSDLKKSTAFVKKIKAINSDGIAQCIKETESLNLTLYVSEIVSGIVATTYKATDVSHMVRLCISLHQMYEEFCEPLCTGLKQALMSPPAEDDPDSGKRKRIQIRFAVELFQAGIFSEEEFFVRLLRNLLGKGKK